MYVLSHDAVSGVSPLALAIAPARHGGDNSVLRRGPLHALAHRIRRIPVDNAHILRVCTRLAGCRNYAETREIRQSERGTPVHHILCNSMRHACVCAHHAAGRLESSSSKDTSARQPPREEIATPRSEHSDVVRLRDCVRGQ